MTEPNLPPQVPSSSAEAGSSPAPAGGEWETVQFPGTLDADSLDAGPATPEPSPEELLQLIQDLNQCNDALLGRVATLEDALERSEAALQTEVERSQQHQSSSYADAQAAITAQQHQVAQLLSELDVANDSLRRATIHNEALQTDLEASQQRVAQLERECTLLQQRFTEKTTALQQAEATYRDLRSRLQRQQRYTLQFKAALEKCLDMAPQRASAEDSQALTMPKAEQIQPWSSGAGAVSPSLDSLLRGLKPTASAPPEAPESPEPEADPAADTQLWQDLERVVESSAAPPPAPTAAETAAFTEPSPWGAPLEATPAAAESEAPVPTRPAASAPTLQMPPTLTAESATSASGSPAPVVHPLRPGKKIKSIAAVQLPSFPKPRPTS